MPQSVRAAVFVAATLAAPLLGLACSTTELVPLVPSEDGVAVVSLDDIELELVETGKLSEPVPPQRIKPRPPVGLGVDPASPFASQTAASSPAVNPPAARITPDPNTSFQADAARGRDVTTGPVRRPIIATAFTGGEIASGETKEGLVYFATPPEHVERLRLIVRAPPKASCRPRPSRSPTP